MTPSRRRAPLSDLSNLSPTASSPSPAGRPPSKRFNPKPINAKGIFLHKVTPSSSEPLSDGGGPETAGTAGPECRTPLSSAAMVMEVDSGLSTPRAMETDETLSLSLKEGRSIIYSRRKAPAPLHLPMSCPPPRHHFKERNLMDHGNRRKAVKRGFSTALLSEDMGSKGASSRSRRHSLPNLRPKQWLPEEFVAAQRSHFAEVDAFKLEEEEGELSDEA